MRNSTDRNMKRPLCIIGFSYAFAMWLAFFVGNSRNLYISAALFASAALAFVILRRQPFAVYATLISVSLISAAAAFASNTLYYNSRMLPYESLYGKDVLIQGVVSGVSTSGKISSYVVEADFPGIQSLHGCRISIRDYGEPRVKTGDIILCEIAADNPDTGYYKSRQIKLRGDLASEMVILEPVSAYEKIVVKKYEIRNRLESNLYSNLKPESADIVGAMVMKIGRGIDPEIYNSMNRSGISHMLSISGLHFSIITAFILGVLRKTMLARRMPEAITLLASGVFVVLTGFSSPVIRAFLMFFIVTIGQMSNRRGDGLNSLGIALLIISLIWPEWVMSVGTWLSFLSTMGIIVAGQPIDRFFRTKLKLPHRSIKYSIVNAVIGGAAISVGAYLFTLPVLILNYGWLSLTAPVTNILIIPFVIPIILGGLLCCVIPGGIILSGIIASVTNFCMSMVLEISKIMGKLPFSVFSIGEFWRIIWFAATVGIAAIVWHYRKTRGMAFTGIMLSVLIFAAGYISDAIPARDTLELVTLEDCASQILIRQKDAVIIGTPGRYDASILLNYLDFRDVDNLAAIIVSDIGENVGSGLLRLGEAYDIDAVIGPDDPYILEQITRALRDVPVYSSGYARIQVLDSAIVTVDKSTGIMTAEILDGTRSTIKRPLRLREISEPGDNFWIFPGGKLILPGNAYPVFSPLGERIFGEVRIVFNIS